MAFVKLITVRMFSFSRVYVFVWSSWQKICRFPDVYPHWVQRYHLTPIISDNPDDDLESTCCGSYNENEGDAWDGETVMGEIAEVEFASSLRSFFTKNQGFRRVRSFPPFFRLRSAKMSSFTPINEESNEQWGSREFT